MHFRPVLSERASHHHLLHDRFTYYKGVSSVEFQGIRGVRRAECCEGCWIRDKRSSRLHRIVSALSEAAQILGRNSERWDRLPTWADTNAAPPGGTDPSARECPMQARERFVCDAQSVVLSYLFPCQPKDSFQKSNRRRESSIDRRMRFATSFPSTARLLTQPLHDATISTSRSLARGRAGR